MLCSRTVARTARAWCNSAPRVVRAAPSAVAAPVSLCGRAAAVRCMSIATATPARASTPDSESHDDFKPKIKQAPASSGQGGGAQGISNPEAAIAAIEKAVKNTPVLLFMKGTPQSPQCGFSQQVVRVLHAHGVRFGSVNVLANEHIRQGVKDYSQWPTIPQLYVDGEFLGGCDIITSMHQSGELEEALQAVAQEE